MRWLILVCLAFLLLAAPVYAEEITQEAISDFGASALESALTEEQQALMDGADPLHAPDLGNSVQKMISAAIRGSSGAVRQAAGHSAVLLSVCLLCSLFVSSAEGAERTAVMAGVLAIAAVCTDSMGGLVRQASDSVQELSAFSRLYLPVLAASAAAAGAITSAPAVYGATVLISDLMLDLIGNLLIPGIYLFLAMQAADCALEHSPLKRFCSLVSWGIKGMLKLILYGFTGFLAATHVVAGSADAMTAKAAKLTLSGVVPVVGSILSDASETLLVSASLIRNSIGVYGLLAVLAVVILPFLRIAIWYLSLRLTAAAAGVTSCSPLVQMLDAAAEAMAMLLAMTGTAALLTVISVVCTLRLAGGT